MQFFFFCIRWLCHSLSPADVWTGTSASGLWQSPKAWFKVMFPPICTDIHIYIHSYKIQISGPIGLFSNKWANGTKYFGLHRTLVGNVLIVELGHRSEFLKRIVNCWQLKRMWVVDNFSLHVNVPSSQYFVLRSLTRSM